MSTIPLRYCHKCGAALGSTVAIVGGLEFHPWCAASAQVVTTTYTPPCQPPMYFHVECQRCKELQAELAALKAENERLFVALKGKGVRQRLYWALKEMDEMAAREDE